MDLMTKNKPKLRLMAKEWEELNRKLAVMIMTIRLEGSTNNLNLNNSIIMVMMDMKTAIMITDGNDLITDI